MPEVRAVREEIWLEVMTSDNDYILFERAFDYLEISIGRGGMDYGGRR